VCQLVFDQLKRRHVEYISAGPFHSAIVAFAGDKKGVALEVFLEAFAVGLNTFMVLDDVCNSLGELHINGFRASMNAKSARDRTLASFK